jgi:hypothetical protein
MVVIAGMLWLLAIPGYQILDVFLREYIWSVPKDDIFFHISVERINTSLMAHLEKGFEYQHFIGIAYESVV